MVEGHLSRQAYTLCVFTWNSGGVDQPCRRRAGGRCVHQVVMPGRFYHHLYFHYILFAILSTRAVYACREQLDEERWCQLQRCVERNTVRSLTAAVTSTSTHALWHTNVERCPIPCTIGDNSHYAVKSSGSRRFHKMYLLKKYWVQHLLLYTLWLLNPASGG